MVGVERFELPTSCSQSRRATGLRYTPKGKVRKEQLWFQTRDEKARSMLAALFLRSSLKYLKELSMGKSKLSGCWLPQELAEKRIQDRLRDWPQRNAARFHCGFV